MTCAHVVNVALKKVPGVETVEVSLIKNNANVKLKAGNTVSVQQLWQLLHEKGYTPKTTTVSVQGELAGTPDRLQLKVSGTGEVLDLVADSKDPSSYSAAVRKIDHMAVIEGVMIPAKDLRARVPLHVNRVK